MNQIVSIEVRKISDKEVQTVNARELHSFLGVGKVFGAWIVDRIEKYDFLEGEDYVLVANVCFPNLESKGRGGHNAKEYFISLDMAKELSMVERTPKGKEARQYFIECEKRLLSNVGSVSDLLPFERASREIAAVRRMLVEADIDKAAALVYANNAVTKATGINLLALGGVVVSATEQRYVLLTPTQMAPELGLKSAQAVNKLLAAQGFQEPTDSGWEPTEKAEGYYHKEVVSAPNAGAPFSNSKFQLKWYRNILEVLE